MSRNSKIAIAGFAVVAVALTVVAGGTYVYQSGGPGRAEEARGLKFDGEGARQYALEQCAIGPRPPGSEAARVTGDYIIATLQRFGWKVETQEWQYEGVPLRNIIGKSGQGPVAVLGAHYDTRPVADEDVQHLDEPITGGNDGASGVAVLLELAELLPQYEVRNQVWLVFFDGEDSGRVHNWPWCVGSSHMAEQLKVEPLYVIVVDMVGDSDQQLYYEGNSDVELREKLWAIAAELEYDQFIPQVRHTMIDDHLPFAQRGVPAVDIIDFDYPYWHTVEDTCDKVSADSLERVGRVLEKFLTAQE